MAAVSGSSLPALPLSLAQRISVAGVALAAGAALGAALALGTPGPYLLAALIGPFVLVLTLARPYWATLIYVVLIYGDLLSVLTRNYNLPPLARFAGIALLSTVLGYRLVIRRQALAHDEMTWWLVAYGLTVAAGIWYAQDASLVQTNVVEFARDFITYLIIINAVTSPARLRQILWFMLGLGTFLALLTIYQSATGQFANNLGGLAEYRVSEITGSADAARPAGTLGDANYYGQFLLIVLPLGIYLAFNGRTLAARLAGLGAAAALALAVIYTYSRGDAVALGVIVVAAVIYRRVAPIYLLGVAVAGLILLPLLPSGYVDRLTTILATATGNQQTIYNEASIRGRAGATQAAIAMFLDHPLLGVGRENYPLHELEYLQGSSLPYKSTGIPPHDLYLEVAAEHGLLGLLVGGGVLVAAWRALREARHHFLRAGYGQHAELMAWLGIGLLGYLVSSLFLHGAFLYILWLQLALIIAARQIARAAIPPGLGR